MLAICETFPHSTCASRVKAPEKERTNTLEDAPPIMCCGSRLGHASPHAARLQMICESSEASETVPLLPWRPCPTSMSKVRTYPGTAPPELYDPGPHLFTVDGLDIPILFLCSCKFVISSCELALRYPDSHSHVYES